MRRRLVYVGLQIILFQGCSYYTYNPADVDNLPNLYDRRIGQVAIIDESIEINAREALNNDLIIPYQSHININVYNGTLLVTGEALDEGVNKQILEKVRILQGVKRVQDEIVDAPETHASSQANDSLTTNRIKTELDNIHDLAYFSSANIKVITENGSVYLMGLVYKEEADRVTSVVQQVPGVTKIVRLFEYLP
ncbi:MAG: BON domain-containing protein [Methylococcales bacterium]